MMIKDKNILILGLGISGVSSAKALKKLGANIIICDSKTEEKLSDYISQLNNIEINFKLGVNKIDLDRIDFIVKSPGVPLEVPILKDAIEKNIEVVTDIELAYRICNNKFIALTGTNGKTTTTTLVGEILKASGRIVHVTGNIGVGILWEVVNSAEDDIFVIETSSFQLESTQFFKPDISVIINITPDHVSWHKGFDNYVNAKKKIFRNQDLSDYTILNYDDEILNNLEDEISSKIIYFSQKQKLDYGVYVDGEEIIINNGKEKIALMKHKDIKIPGRHNLENSLASIAVSWIMGIDLNTLAETLRGFEGVEHRLEYVDTINSVKFYNDSKGTNPDSSIQALETIEAPIILIAGGYDKGSDYTDFIKSFNGKVTSLILLGETKKKFKNCAISLGFNNIYIVESMKEAVDKSFEISKINDTVLLSPASASWDMYNSFEERGKDFKKCVNCLRGLNNGQKGVK